MDTPLRRIAISTGGGGAAGLNAVIRAVVWAATILLLVAMPAKAAPAFLTLSLSEDGRRLDYTDVNRATFSAPSLKDQVGFSSASISADGQFIGWLALYGNCCSSGSIPLVLVVMDASRRLHEFRGDQATFSWCFQATRGIIAYRRERLHGPTSQLFERRQVMDGQLLERFELEPQEPGGAALQQAELPGWARCAAD